MKDFKLNIFHVAGVLALLMLILFLIAKYQQNNPKPSSPVPGGDVWDKFTEWLGL